MKAIQYVVVLFCFYWPAHKMSNSGMDSTNIVFYGFWSIVNKAELDRNLRKINNDCPAVNCKLYCLE